jgi:hypothetical protein
MKASTVFPAIGLVAGIRAQTGEFEAPDFNITEALATNGINVSALPQLAPLAERSPLSGCSIAVSVYQSNKSVFSATDMTKSATR